PGNMSDPHPGGRYRGPTRNGGLILRVEIAECSPGTVGRDGQSGRDLSGRVQRADRIKLVAGLDGVPGGRAQSREALHGKLVRSVGVEGGPTVVALIVANRDRRNSSQKNGVAGLDRRRTCREPRRGWRTEDYLILHAALPFAAKVAASRGM